MMKKTFLTLLCLLTFAISTMAGTWVKQDMDGMGSIDYPAKPVVSDIKGRKDILLMTDSCYFLTKVTTIARNNIIHDSTTLFTFYKGVVKGILRGDKGIELRQDPLKVGGVNALELVYASYNANQQPMTVCSRMLLANGKLLVYTFSSPTSRYGSLRSVKEHFFSTLELKDAAAIVQYNYMVDSASAHDATNSMPAAPAPDSATVAEIRSTHSELVRQNTLHFILSFAGSILGLAAILYLIVRWRKKNNSQTP